MRFTRHQDVIGLDSYRAFMLPYKALELSNRQGSSKKIPLICIATGVFQNPKLQVRLDPFGNGADMEVMCHGDDGVNKGNVMLAGDHIPNK